MYYKEHQRLSEQITVDEQRLTKYLESLSQQVTRYKKKSQESEKAIKVLEKKNADMTLKLQAQCKASTPKRSAHKSDNSPSPAHTPQSLSRPRHKAAMISTTPSSSSKSMTSSVKQKQQLSSLISKLSASRLAFKEIQGIQQSLHTIVNEKAHLSQELSKLKKKSSTRSSEKVSAFVLSIVKLRFVLNVRSLYVHTGCRA